MVRWYDEYPHPPYITSVTTILHLKCVDVIFRMSSDLRDNEIANTPAGAAFKRFLRAVKEEEGFESITWGPNLQINNAVSVFIGT